MEKNITYLKDIETVECPFKFAKDLLTAYQPERSKREDFGFYGRPIIDELFDDNGNLIQRCGALNSMET